MPLRMLRGALLTGPKTNLTLRVLTRILTFDLDVLAVGGSISGFFMFLCMWCLFCHRQIKFCDLSDPIETLSLFIPVLAFAISPDTHGFGFDRDSPHPPDRNLLSWAASWAAMDTEDSALKLISPKHVRNAFQRVLAKPSLPSSLLFARIWYGRVDRREVWRDFGLVWRTAAWHMYIYIYNNYNR